MFAQHRATFVHLDAAFQGHIALFKFAHDGFKLLQRLFEGRAETSVCVLASVMVRESGSSLHLIGPNLAPRRRQVKDRRV